MVCITVGFADDSAQQGDIAPSAVGLKAETQLEVGAGLTTRLGVVVDDHLQTSVPDI